MLVMPRTVVTTRAVFCIFSFKPILMCTYILHGVSIVKTHTMLKIVYILLLYYCFINKSCYFYLFMKWIVILYVDTI